MILLRSVCILSQSNLVRFELSDATKRNALYGGSKATVSSETHRGDEYLHYTHYVWPAGRQLFSLPAGYGHTRVLRVHSRMDCSSNVRSHSFNGREDAAMKLGVRA